MSVSNRRNKYEHRKVKLTVKFLRHDIDVRCTKNLSHFSQFACVSGNKGWMVLVSRLSFTILENVLTNFHFQ